MHILVAGMGNIFLGDSAFGIEVARRLAARPLPVEVRVADFGVRGYDLAYALMDGPDLIIFLDSISRGGAPGTLYAIEPEIARGQVQYGPANILRLVQAMGQELKRVIVIGCEPGAIDEDGELGLSPPVRASVEPAVSMVEALIKKEIAKGRRPQVEQRPRV